MRWGYLNLFASYAVDEFHYSVGQLRLQNYQMMYILVIHKFEVTSHSTVVLILACIEVFHTRDENHVTAGANPFWGSSFAAAVVGAVDNVIKTCF